MNYENYRDLISNANFLCKIVRSENSLWNEN